MADEPTLLNWLHTYWKEISAVVLGIAAVSKNQYDLGSIKSWKKALEEKGIVTLDMCHPAQKSCQDIITERLIASDKLLTERLARGDDHFRLLREDISLLRDDYATIHTAVAKNTERQDSVLEILATVKMRHDNKPARERDLS